MKNVMIIILLLFPFLCHSAKIQRKADCPVGYDDHILILMSMDGFKPDYLTRGLTPTIQKLIDEGVSTPYMRATYPTVTFPNHYTIATGLYPESHGIIANSFYDSVFNEAFSTGRGSLSDGKWFGGEPIWSTVIRNGMLSATYFWPGSEAEIDGIRPTYYYNYTDDTPFDERIEQVLDWLVLPIEERPSWICVYFNEPDHTAHESGPDSPEVDIQLAWMDANVSSLVDGIANLGLTDCVNLIIVSDHGMAAAGESKVINLETYDPILDEKAYIYYGANSRLDMNEGYENEQIPVMESLSCKTENMRQFDQESLAKRYHYSNNRRIEDIILGLDAGYAVNFESDFFLDGQHGYDNEYLEMQTIFIATGPDFKEATVIRPFQSLELYNLMCDLLSIEPADNNGTKGSLYHIMNNPPAYPELPLGSYPDVATFPNEDDIPGLLDTSVCSGDLTAPEDWINTLDFVDAEQANLDSIHIPFGPPIYTSSISNNITILYHSDHITGFSSSLKMPVWTSFTFNLSPIGTQETLWSSDVRLSASDSPKCSDYDTLNNLTMNPLFHPDFSEDQEMDRVPFMISNALPMSDELVGRYSEMMTGLIPLWQQNHGGPVNVIAGPVFDNNFDSLVDDFPAITEGPEKSLSLLPSDVFVIVTKCSSQDIENLRNCTIDELEVSAFIYRQFQTVPNCLDAESYAVEFSARVKDIELSTGLIFFSDLDYQNAIDLSLRCLLGIWPTDGSQSHNMGSSYEKSFHQYFIVLMIILFKYF